MLDIYGTIGPACADSRILREMFREGMTGIRLNTSHVSLKEAEEQILMIHDAAAACGIRAKLLIDLQGPELRIGSMEPSVLKEQDQVLFVCAESESSSFPEAVRADTGGNVQKISAVIPVMKQVYQALEPGTEVLLDDGKILLTVIEDKRAAVLRGGILKGKKSIALKDVKLSIPAMTAQDYRNIKDAAEYGVTGVMQPFVRNAEDLKQVRTCLNSCGGEKIRLLAKIENRSGVENLESFYPYSDEIVIARGDLGNAVPLWELPRIQKNIESRCRAAGIPFMVVTQMLASMEHSAVPTRAEVSDIYNAVCDGAASVMVTGETAAGQYPVEVIRYLVKTVQSFINNKA